MKRKDINREEKSKLIKELHDDWAKLMSKRHKKSRGVRLAAKPAVSKTVTEGSSPSHPAQRCPHCNSTNVHPILPFDHIWGCKNCKKEFMP